MEIFCYESEEYLKTTREYFTVNEKLAIHYLLAERPLQGSPIEGYPEVLSLEWGKNPGYHILYTVSVELGSIYLLVVHPISEHVTQDYRAKEIIKRLVVVGSATQVKDLLKFVIEHIKEKIEEYL